MPIRCFVFALCFLVTIVASAEAQQRQKVIVTSPSVSFNQFPVYVALEKGFYRQENLDVLIVVMDGTIATRALIAGDVDYLLAFASGASAILKGAPLKGVMEITKKGTASFVTGPSINSGADLKGKVIGASGFGGEIYYFVLEVLEHYGLNPKRDVSILNVGNSALRLAALRTEKSTLPSSIPVRSTERRRLDSNGSSPLPI
ncbi:MAG: ABC transporter substrate-binding protein [Alphaproteobacteria bacterium]